MGDVGESRGPPEYCAICHHDHLFDHLWSMHNGAKVRRRAPAAVPSRLAISVVVVAVGDYRGRNGWFRGKMETNLCSSYVCQILNPLLGPAWPSAGLQLYASKRAGADLSTSIGNQAAARKVSKHFLRLSFPVSLVPCWHARYNRSCTGDPKSCTPARDRTGLIVISCYVKRITSQAEYLFRYIIQPLS